MPSSLMKPQISQQNGLCLAFIDPPDKLNLAKNLSFGDSCRALTELLQELRVPKEHTARAKDTGAIGHTGAAPGGGLHPLPLYKSNNIL